MVELKENERIDDLEIRGFRIIQNPLYFCFGCDAVLLSDFARPRKRDRVMDLCTGTGIVPILMAAKEKGLSFEAIEINTYMAEMAGRSAALNEISDTLHVTEGDIRNIKELYKNDSFDYLTVNPPYIKENGGLLNPDDAINVARHEMMLSLKDVIQAASYLLKSRGGFAMVHKPFRLPEIIYLMKQHRIEPKRLRMVQPKAGAEPTMMLIEGVKDGGEFMKVEPPLIMYEENGSYTEELLRIYGKM